MHVDRAFRTEELEKVRAELEMVMNGLVDMGEKDFDRLFGEGTRS